MESEFTVRYRIDTLFGQLVERGGSKSEELTDFRVKSDQSARRVITGTDVPGKTALYLGYQWKIL
jgi:hypothetical protein